MAPDLALSQREREVLDHLGRGLRDKEIAAQLGISIETVRTHVRNAMRTIGAHTREHAVALISQRR
ncbi:MAG: response regulator transcription factor [Candidatus Limnocylindria bacterium]